MAAVLGIWIALTGVLPVLGLALLVTGALFVAAGAVIGILAP
jgi:hypothetical protein